MIKQIDIQQKVYVLNIDKVKNNIIDWFLTMKDTFLLVIFYFVNI